MLIFCFHSGTAEISSFSQIFLLGKGIKDLDEDNLGEKVSLSIIIPDIPNAHELAVAGDIAARANLESLVVNFSLVKKESEVKSIENLENPILVGTNLKWINKLKKEGKINLPLLKHNQGFVFLFSYKNISRLTIRFAEERVNLAKPKRFYADPYRWRQETFFPLSFP